ncbi:MAG: FecR domain-containing protein [Firmicutes bacterium]|nr:FecR domain-containing protein [Bacillota bacterium]
MKNKLKAGSILCIMLSILLMASLVSNVFAAPKATPKAKPQASPSKPAVAEKPAAEAPAKLVYVADIITVQGDGLKVKRVNSPNWMRGKVNMADYIKDVLETDGNTMACIEFLNGSQVALNKNTAVEIITSSQVSETSPQAEKVSKMIVKNGTAWAKIRGTGNDLKVQTGKGVLGVKGTEFIIESDPAQNTEKVTVLEGRVEYESGGKTETLNPGQEATVSGNNTVQVKNEDIKALRDALNLRFPNLDPAAQMIIGVFSAQLMGSMNAEVSNALSIANDTLSVVDNPESYLKDRISSEIGSRTGISVPNIFGGGGGQQEEKKPEAPKNLQPANQTLSTYYPKFTWDKVEKAKSYRVVMTRNPLEKDAKDPQFYMYAKTENNELVYPDYARALKPGMDYYWSVIPLGEDGKPIAPSSDPIKITMADYQTLGIKGLYPTGDVKPSSGEMVFDWTPVSGVTKYKVEVSNKQSMESPIVSKEVDSNFLVLDNASQYFSSGKDYFWKVTPVAGENGVPSINSVVNHFKAK